MMLRLEKHRMWLVIVMSTLAVPLLLLRYRKSDHQSIVVSDSIVGAGGGGGHMTDGLRHQLLVRNAVLYDSRVALPVSRVLDNATTAVTSRHLARPHSASTGAVTAATEAGQTAAKAKILTPKQVQIKLEETKQNCLKLGPAQHVFEAGRQFTADELDVTRYANRMPLIPKRIHQQWNTYEIPEAAVPHVRSVVELHPDWEYWFWTEADRECYMKTHHADLLELYHSYPHAIFRTNLVRYFLLYDYGGFYLDLDVRALKPLDVWAHMGSSVLTHETYEHTYFAHKRPQPNVMNTVMATRAKHPFYARLREHLLEYNKVCPKLNLYSNGVFYVDNQYQTYIQSHVNRSAHDDVIAIHPRYWLPTYASATVRRIKQQCKVGASLSALTPQQRDLCVLARARNLANDVFPDTYLQHFWANSNVKGSAFLRKGTKSMFAIVPNLRKVSDILGLQCA